jgi:hypothetical protein
LLRFTPAIKETLLEILQSARPQVAQVLAAARAARITIESLEDSACRMRIAQFHLELIPAAAEDYTLLVAWADPATDSQRNLRLEGIAPMLGGSGDVFFAQRSGGQNRFLLKLSYDAGGAALYAFPGAFAERLPAALRVLLPTQLGLGRVEGCV